MSERDDRRLVLVTKAVTEFQALEVLSRRSAAACVALIDAQHALNTQMHQAHLALHELWVEFGRPVEEGS